MTLPFIPSEQIRRHIVNFNDVFHCKICGTFSLTEAYCIDHILACHQSYFIDPYKDITNGEQHMKYPVINDYIPNNNYEYGSEYPEYYPQAYPGYVGGLTKLTGPVKVHLTEKQAIDMLDKACDGKVGDDVCATIAALVSAGWKVSKDPAVDADGRKGFVITVLEPKKKG